MRSVHVIFMGFFMMVGVVFLTLTLSGDERPDGNEFCTFLVHEVCHRTGGFQPFGWGAPVVGIVTWLILPVVICLSQRLSHACLSINKFIL